MAIQWIVWLETKKQPDCRVANRIAEGGVSTMDTCWMEFFSSVKSQNGCMVSKIAIRPWTPEWVYFRGNYSLNECEEPTTSCYQHCSVQNLRVITKTAIPGWLERTRLLLAPPAGWNTRLDCNSIPAAFFLSFPSQLCVIESGNVTGLIAWTSECSAGAGMNTMHCEPLVQATLWFFFFFFLNALHSPLFRAAAATFQDFGRVGSPVNFVFGWR